eukprot:GHVO01003634.1.p1 GENE.GHVO01003634.1~~GHVO01003634.1.p1  ORF type:complete len:166 (+),score=7.74 GHVO01003634.1:701-1198(+)
MPFGMINAPATFQRAMDTVLGNLRYRGVLVYIDDVLVHTRTEEEHIPLLLKVLERLRDADLYINDKKCYFVKTELTYLGHIVDANGIKPDPVKVQALHSLASPSDVASLRRQLGLLGYYRQFIPDFATTAKPIYTLLRDNTPFLWSSELTEQASRRVPLHLGFRC